MRVGQNIAPWCFSNDEKELTEQVYRFKQRGNQIWRNNYPGAGEAFHVWRPFYDPEHPYRVANKMQEYGIQTIWVCYNGNDDVKGWELYEDKGVGWSRIYAVANLINKSRYVDLDKMLPKVLKLPRDTIFEIANADVYLAGAIPSRVKALQSRLELRVGKARVLPVGTFLYANANEPIVVYPAKSKYVSEYGCSNVLDESWMRYLHGHLAGADVDIACHHVGCDPTQYELWREGFTMRLWDFPQTGSDYIKVENFLPEHKTSTMKDMWMDTDFKEGSEDV